MGLKHLTRVVEIMEDAHTATVIGNISLRGRM